MSDPHTPRPAGRAGSEELPDGIDDPSALIYDVWAAAAAGEVDGQAVFELAAAPELARAATPESVNRLLGVVWETAARIGAAAISLAEMAELHASAIDDLGGHRLALGLYDGVRPLIERYAGPGRLGHFLLSRAGVLHRLGSPEAVAGYDEALPLLRGHAPPVQYAACLMNRANALQERGCHAEAVAGYDEALPLLERQAPPAQYASCLVNRAVARVVQGRRAEAAAGLGGARRALRQFRRQAAASDTDPAGREVYDPFFDRVVRTGLSAVLPDAAYDAVRDAKAGVADDLAFPTGETRGPEPADVGAARSALTDWMRTQAPRSPNGDPSSDADADRSRDDLGAFLQGRAERTRQFLGAWRQHAQGDNPIPPTPEVEDGPTRAEVQAALPDRWALIDFWRTGDDEFHAFVLFRDDFQVVRLPFPVEQHAEKLTRLACSLRQVTDAEPRLEGLDDLYTLLFLPLLPLLKEKATEGLYLVPHGFLHPFPLHAARLGTRHLCDQFAIAYLPSSALLPRLPRPDPTGRPFVLANPEAGTRMTLPFSDWEGRQLRDRLGVPDDTFFLGDRGRFTAADRWADCGLVHFGCHGCGDEQFAPLSHLRLADDLLMAHDVFHRKPGLRPGAVIVLNGCQTSAPDWQAVDQGMGLMTAFLLRGAGVVLSTQWNVMGQCAADVVLTFVDEVRKPATSPAAALKVAQDRLRKTPAAVMLARMEVVERQFSVGSPEAGKVLAQKAWLCCRTGLLDEAVAAAELAAPYLRESGLAAEADLLIDRARHARRRMTPDRFEQAGYESLIFWGAFRLIGRVT
jgi:CHAT domain-containing protein